MSKESRKKSSRSSAGQSVRRSAVAPRSGKAGVRVGTKVAAPPKAASKAKPATKAGSAKAGAKTPARSLAASKPAAKRVKPPATQSRTAGSAPGPVALLQEGAIAPDFTLPRDGGGTIRLADYTGRKLVLFFYPKANTPGCTREAIDFTRLSQDFATSGTAVLGVSADSVKAQDGFRDKHQLAVPLLSDSTHEMLAAYGAWGEKTLYGRKFLGIIRSTVLIGGDGRIARIWRNVKVDGHAEAVLDAARAL
jgi:thioredoxin-dependent peroxiredoxin